jgi:hypothetical protein
MPFSKKNVMFRTAHNPVYSITLAMRTALGRKSSFEMAEPLRSQFFVILNGAKRSEESRLCWCPRDSSVAPLPQNDKLGHFRRSLMTGNIPDSYRGFQKSSFNSTEFDYGSVGD